MYWDLQPEIVGICEITPLPVKLFPPSLSLPRYYIRFTLSYSEMGKLRDLQRRGESPRC
jgi:hypothetical protein